MAPLSPLTVPNSPTRERALARLAPRPRRESDTATVSYSLNAAITRSSMALHPDLLDKHLLLLSRPAILNPTLAFPTYACVIYIYIYIHLTLLAAATVDGRRSVEIDLRCRARGDRGGVNNRSEIEDDRRKSGITRNNREATSRNTDFAKFVR